MNHKERKEHEEVQLSFVFFVSFVVHIALDAITLPIMQYYAA